MQVFNANELKSGLIDCTNVGIYDISLSADGIFFIVKVYENNDIVYKMKHDTYSGAKRDYLETISSLAENNSLRDTAC
jgi:hypothetical protein